MKQTGRAHAVFATRAGEAGIDRAYSDTIRKELEAQLDFVDMLQADDLNDDHTPADPATWARFREVRYIFTTWGMPALSRETIRSYFPALEAVFYAAGSVQSFARPFLDEGVRIFSAWEANAIPVAEYTLAQIILAGKRFFHASRLYSEVSHAEAAAVGRGCHGNYDLTVSLLGCGAIGRAVIEFLRPFNYHILVFDPFLPEEEAAALGVKLVPLHTAFEEGNIISNHLANNEHTVGMLNGECFQRMKPDATFINTGRGAQVVEDELIEALEAEPLREALLDVTWPEPVAEDHPFRTMPNVVLTPHIAGSLGAEIFRMGSYMAESFTEFSRATADDRVGQLPREVTLEMLEHMA